MDTGQALTRFFKRDSTKANNLTLYPHKEEEFWLWVSSWALYISKPSDLGYDDTGYDLPPLDVRYHKLCMDAAPVVGKDGQEHFQREASVSLKDAAAVKRESIGARVAKAAEIVNDNPQEHFILWHDLEAERHTIKHALPEAVEIYGSQELDEQERNTIAFPTGKSGCWRLKKSYLDPVAIFRSIATGQSSLGLTMNSTTLFKQSTEFIVFCRASGL